jgi:hypothetical protein
VRIIFGDIFNIQKSKHHPVWMHGQEHPRSIYLKLILLFLTIQKEMYGEFVLYKMCLVPPCTRIE